MDRLDAFYMDTAVAAANLSRAVRLKVGAVAVFDRNIIGFSFNGTPAGDDNNCEDKVYMSSEDSPMEDYPFCDLQGRYRLVTKLTVLHAEENVITKIASSNNSCKNATLFVTHSPCIRCARMIHSAGFTRLIYANPYWDQTPIDFLKSKNISCELYNEQINQNPSGS